MAKDGGEKNSIWAFVLATLRGLGQIMFQENAATGGFFLCGLLVAAPIMALGGLLGSALGTATALTLGFAREDVKRGLFGFNSALTGIGLLFFLEANVGLYVLLIVACILTAVLAKFMIKILPMPVFTSPFVIATWLFLALASALSLPRASHLAGSEGLDVVAGALAGLSEVMLQNSVLCGAFFFLGILANSREQAVWALAASVLGMLIAYWHHDPSGQISAGLYGYNAALTAMALTSRNRTLILPVLGVLLSVMLTEGFLQGPLETLTAPFVLATWLSMAVGHWDRLYQAKADAVTLARSR